MMKAWTQKEIAALDPVANQAEFLPFAPAPDPNALRTLDEILSDLNRPIHPSITKTKEKKNRNGDVTVITFIEWHMADEILDRYAPGWEWEPVISLSADGQYATCHGVLTIPTSDRGKVRRGAAGGIEDDEKQYGEPCHHAESQAFRRACAKFRLCLRWYHK
jgi:hypothetical protein